MDSRSSTRFALAKNLWLSVTTHAPHLADCFVVVALHRRVEPGQAGVWTFPFGFARFGHLIYAIRVFGVSISILSFDLEICPLNGLY